LTASWRSSCCLQKKSPTRSGNGALRKKRAASALNHPNIVHIYDIANEGGIDIAMELVEGRTLSEIIGSRGLRAERVLKYGAQVADALAKSHAAGTARRDCSRRDSAL
jgi:serine/threonine protein kinase